MRGFIAAMGALALLSSPALAQDGSEPVQTRSPEQAQAFFAELHTRYGSHASWTVSHPSATMISVKRRLASISSPSRCVTRLTFADDGQELLSENPRPTVLPLMAPLDIDWSRVTIVERSMGARSAYMPDFKAVGIGINSAVPGGTRDRLHLTIDTGEPTNWTVLDRMQVAAQFLIEQCYQRSETGF